PPLREQTLPASRAATRWPTRRWPSSTTSNWSTQTPSCRWPPTSGGQRPPSSRRASGRPGSSTTGPLKSARRPTSKLEGMNDAPSLEPTEEELSEQAQVRRAKRDRLIERGDGAYPVSLPITTTV